MPMLSSKSIRHSSWSYAGPLRGAPVSDVVRVKVALIEIVPPIWRRLRVPAHMTLRRFHTVLQETIGWKDVQPHRFRVGEILFGKPSDPADAVKDSRWITIQDLISAGAKTFHYDYGFGSGWIHEVRIEARFQGTPENQRVVCLGGERACPPEESGGPDDYVERIVASRNPYLEDRSRPDRLRPSFDPEQFDLEEVNATLAALQF
jgi:hypothetical protein